MRGGWISGPAIRKGLECPGPCGRTQAPARIEGQAGYTRLPFPDQKKPSFFGL